MEIRNRESSFKSGLESVSTQKSIANFKQDFLYFSHQRMITITLRGASVLRSIY